MYKLFSVLIAVSSIAMVSAGGRRFPVGHLKEKPFADLYQKFVRTFIPFQQTDRYMNGAYVPTAELCIEYFDTEYKITLWSFSLFDACSGYLFEAKEFHSEDMKANPIVEKRLESQFYNTQNNDLFKRTRLNNYDDKVKNCIHNLLDESIDARRKAGEAACSSEWRKVLTNFYECQHYIPERAKVADSYIVLIRKLVDRLEGQCYDINNHAVKIFDESIFVY